MHCLLLRALKKSPKRRKSSGVPRSVTDRFEDKFSRSKDATRGSWPYY